MKRLMKKTKGVVKGVPSAVLLSAVIHVVLLLVAGGLIVFTAVERKEKKFVPPQPVERPKMDLIKPKVRMKSQPKAGAPIKITTKAQPLGLPEMSLPTLAGMGEGLGSGVGGFEMMPDLSEMTLLGSPKSAAVGNDFEGTFYIFNWDRDGEQLGDFSDNWSDYAYFIFEPFLDGDWNPFVFLPYYRSPQKMYATQFMVPRGPATIGPRAFGMSPEREDETFHWGVHYKGKIKSEKGGRFRFWAAGEDSLFIRVDGKLLINASWPQRQSRVYDKWIPSSEEHCLYQMGMATVSVGDWFDLEPGQIYEMEVLFADFQPINCALLIMIEDEAEEYYHREKDGMPVLPVFKTAEMSKRTKDAIKYTLGKNVADLEGGPTFNVY
jgi:hypothetical protein